MLNRFQKDVLDFKPAAVVILGGSNDIGWGINANEIFQNLKTMYDKTIKKSILLVVCTVPSILGFDSLIQPRIDLNQMIKHYSMNLKVPCADIFAATSDRVSNRLREEYSDDGLHLNNRGYQMIGKSIFSAAGKLILDYLNQKSKG
jgi:lysophospholipase L1-like esterase